MPITEVTIINMALGHVGESQLIASRSELSNERVVIDLYYDHVVELVLSKFNWGFARRYIELGLVEEEPNEEYLYSYRYPNTAVAVYRMVTGLGRNYHSPYGYVIANDDTGKLIWTNQENAVAEMTKLVTNTALFPPLFSEAVSLYLAARSCAALSKSPERAAQLLAMAEASVRTAEAHDANESQHDPEPESEAIRARA